MARPFAMKFYNSKAWIECREGYRTKVYGLCERCNGPGEEVHHKIYLSPNNINDPYITLSWENLELLCQSCHSKQHMTKHNVLMDDVMFNADGDLIAMPPL